MRQSTSIRLLIFFAVCVAFEGRASTVPEIVAKAKPAVVQVIASDSNWTPIRTGTGFFVSADGNLLTNFHVIQGATHISARTNKGAIFVFERVITESADSDVALLKFQAADVDYLKVGSSTEAVEGETVLVIGNPEGLQGTVSNGIISAFRENRSYIQITAPVSPGSSGSPVLDETGQVIGMATLVSKEGQSLNFAISAEIIEAVVRSGSVHARPAVSATPSPAPNEKLARQYYSEGLTERNSEKAVEEYTAAILAKPDFAEAYFERAKAYSALGNYSGAIADFSEVLRLKPVEVEPGQSVDNAEVSRAEIYYQLGDYCSTIAFCSDAIRLSPSNMFAYFYRGLGYFGLKQYTKAVEDYSAAIQLWPGYSAAYESRARAYQSMGDVNKANADFKKAEQIRDGLVQVAPTSTPTPSQTPNSSYPDLPVEEDAETRYPRLIKEYTEGITQNPNDTQLYLWRGECYESLAENEADHDFTQAIKQYDKAISDFTQAIKVDAHFHLAYSARAGVYCKLKQFEKAIDDYTALIELEPNDYYPYQCRAWTQHQLKQYDQAIADCTEAIRLDPKYSDAYYYRGRPSTR